MIVRVDGSSTAPFDVAQRAAPSASAKTRGLMRPTASSDHALAANVPVALAAGVRVVETRAAGGRGAATAGTAASASPVDAPDNPDVKPIPTASTAAMRSRDMETRKDTFRKFEFLLMVVMETAEPATNQPAALSN